MTKDLAALKAAEPLPKVVSETDDIDRSGKCLCRFHSDTRPSCQIYEYHFHCFACGAHGDVLDWLKAVYDLTTAAAIRELERRAGGAPASHAAPRRAPPTPKAPTFKPVALPVLEAHRRRAAQLDRVPAAMAGRGFNLADLKALSFAAHGQDAVFPIPGPDGAVLALKRRFADPPDGVRYRYITPGHGTPAWCSPGFLERDGVLIVEGELNGMACWLAAPELAVMGIAGTGGALHLSALRGRTIYCYGDGDDPGQKARDKWSAQALSAGAPQVFVLEPWPLDACDLAGSEGRAALSERLTASLVRARSFGAVKSFSASNTAPKGLRLAQHKPDLGFSGSRFSSGPKLGGKPCL